MTHKRLIRNCPVCGFAQGEILHKTQFVLMEGNGLAECYDVVSCLRCCFVFADTPSTQKDYDWYYSAQSKYEDAHTGTGSGVSPADAARLQRQAAHIASFLPHLNTRIVDIGCANGGLLNALKALGYTNLTGIDPSPVCARNTSAHGGIEAFTGTFAQLPSTGKPFDVILLTGVLEHVLDISAAVDSLSQILAKDGMVYISVPDASRYSEFLYAPFQDFSIEHINHFTVRSLTNLMVLKGYQGIASGQQITLAPPNLESPSAFGYFRHTSLKGELVPDKDLKQELSHYIQVSQQFMDRLEQQLASAFEQYPHIIVWGTGQLAFKLLTLTAVTHARIAAFVDGNPINQGAKLLGKTILAPEQIKNMPYPILITTTLHQRTIENVIRSLGLKNKIILLR